HHLSDCRVRAVALQDHCDDRPRGDVRHQRLKERFPLVLCVVRFPEGPAHPDEFHRGNLETPALESGDDFPDEAALHRVRLQEDEGPLGHVHFPFLAFFAVGAGASSSSAGSRLRPFTSCHRPSSQDLKDRRPSGESFHASNSALSIRVTGLAPCFFFDQPTIDVWNALLATKSEYCRSRSPRERSGPNRLSIRSDRSEGMSFPFGVSIMISTARASGAGVSSETETASSAATRPAARRNAWVHGVHRGTRPSFNMFAWHLCEQKRKTVPSFRMNILPVPGSISLPQNEHDRRVGIVSPDRELAGLACRLAQHQDVADLDAALHVARDDAALVATVEDADLDLDRFCCHPGPADDLDDLRGNADVLRQHDELRLAALDELRDLVRPLADFPGLLRELDRLIGLVDELLRHLESNVHRLGHRGDLLPPRGRGTSSVIGSPSSEKRPSKWRGL